MFNWQLPVRVNSVLNVHFMDKLSIKPLDTQATVVGKCRQIHDVRHCKERLFQQEGCSW